MSDRFDSLIDAATNALAATWLDEIEADPDAGAPDRYGTSFADVYDDWYPDSDVTEPTVDFLVARSRIDSDHDDDHERNVLELGAGTGRLAIPLAARLGPGAVIALDASPAMLDLLRGKPGGEAVTCVLGDMAGPLPTGPFALVVVATNTIFNLAAPGEQERCVANVARRLRPGGRFVIEAFVPDDAAPDGDRVTSRPVSPGHVVLTASRTDLAAQLVVGCHVEVVDDQVLRRRPWKIRWKTPAQIDALCAVAGLQREERVSNWSRDRFDADSTAHVSVYRRATT